MAQAIKLIIHQLELTTNFIHLELSDKIKKNLIELIEIRLNRIKLTQ